MAKGIPEKLVINVNDANARSKIGASIEKLLKADKRLGHRKIITLCIGSDRYIGDALGPLIGSYLEEHTNCTVYGSLEEPVHAGNLMEVIRHIHHQYYQPLIIAVDACLGKSYEIGNIEIWQGSLEAGIAVGTTLPSVGDLSIIGVVNASGYVGYLDLQSSSLSIVVKLSKCIGGALGDVLDALPVHQVVD